MFRVYFGFGVIRWWQTGYMVKRLSGYSFLIVTVATLIFGLVLSGANPLAANLSWIFGAGIGFALATGWLIRAIRNREFGSDALAVISILATVLTGEFLAASVISVMLASGRALERWAEGRARHQLEALLARAPRVAHRLSANGLDDVLLAQVAIGDRLLVRGGEVVPIDGTLQTEGTFDESALTGEPLPRWRAAGETVASGVLNAHGEVELITTQTAESSTYENLIRLVQQAQATSANGVRLANVWAVRFVPFALLLSIGTWVVTGKLSAAVAVIVAATPCPLILAVPVAIIAGMSKSAANGAIIKGGAALEQLASAETVLLDKTGTLTRGGPEIADIALAPGATEAEVLALAGSLEQSSPHVVARTIVAAAKNRNLELTRASNVVEQHGIGLTGTVDGKQVEVGQPRGGLPEWCNFNHSLLVYIWVDEKLQAVLGLDDPVREESANTIASMRRMGINRILIISGDRKATADAVGQAVGADEVHAECSPEDKLRIVRAESEHGKVIAVGDGINDAPALAAAAVGVAMGARGSTAASEAADVVIVEDSIKHLATAINIAKQARARALQSSGVGMSLAIAAMLAASVGFTNATESAVLQEFIDAAAILWALVPSRNRIE